MCKKRTLIRTSHLLHSFFCIRPSPYAFSVRCLLSPLPPFLRPFAEILGELSPGVKYKDYYHLVDVLLLYLEPGLRIIDHAVINYEIMFISGTVGILINGTTLFAAI